jgi:hypothetical protein
MVDENFFKSKFRYAYGPYRLLDRQVPRKPRPLGVCQGAQYKTKLPSREAPPFRAGSFIMGIPCGRLLNDETAL